MASFPASWRAHMACCYPDLYYHWGIAGKEIKKADVSFSVNEKPGRVP